MAVKETLADKVINLASRRGLIVATSEVYGGWAGFYDYLGYGAQLKRNVESAWWKYFVESRNDVTGLDGAIITHPKVWQASGHTESFNDPLVECEKCKENYRADTLIEEQTGEAVDGLSIDQLSELLNKHKVACPKCKGTLVFKQPFNLMFKTKVGAKDNASFEAYLRPETAQVIFSNFRQAAAAARAKLPFGIAQVGKSFRNEISPRNFVFRTREFTQMELEYFVHPQKLNECQFLTHYALEKEYPLVTQEELEAGGKARTISLKQALDEKLVGTRWHAYWLYECFEFLHSLGIKPGKLRARRHAQTELSHYSSETWDLEYEFPWGFKELCGIANRSDFDLKQHSAHSGVDFTLFDEETKSKVLPYVFEPSFGADRLVFTLLLDAFTESTQAEGSTVVLKLRPQVAPLNAAILPLMKRNGLDEKAREVYDHLKRELRLEYDESGSVGKRYARYDEVGVPYCVTIDYDTLKDNTVTMRDRDSTKQVRLPIKHLASTIRELNAGRLKFEDAGEPYTRPEKPVA